VYCVAFWFTRRADSFRLCWYPERYEPWVNNAGSREGPGGSHTCFPLQLSTSKLTIFLASRPTVQLSPTMVVTHVSLKKVHVTMPSGPTASTFFFGTHWHVAHIRCIHVHPSDVSPTHYFSSSGFCDFGLRNFLHRHLPLLPKFELLKLPSALLLDPTVKIFFPNLQCRYSQGFGVLGFGGLCLSTPLFSQQPKSQKASPGTFSGSNTRKGFSLLSKQILQLQHPKC
jgi:hypothetical protein